jgi:hypothetical protein
MEMLYIQKSKVELTYESTCNSYDEIRKAHSIARRYAPYTFLEIGRPSIDFDSLFFMTLIQKEPQSYITFDIEMSITYEEGRRRNLQRFLDSMADENITCKSTTVSGNTTLVKCGNGNSKAKGIDFIDDKIAGVPENFKIPKGELPNEKELEEMKNIPSLNITNISSNNCSSTGKYIIKGTSNKAFENAEKITIPFSSPDSSGLCKVELNNLNVTINCENTEQFESPDFISIAPQLIKYDNGTNLFRIVNDYSTAGFSCAISDNSLKKPFLPSPSNAIPSTEIHSTSVPVPVPSTDSQGSTKRTNYSKKSSGLSGGAIAGIVFACVAVLAAVITLFALGKSGFFSKSLEVTTSIDNTDNTTSINRLNFKNSNPI